jgi:hypothetical protein
MPFSSYDVSIMLGRAVGISDAAAGVSTSVAAVMGR